MSPRIPPPAHLAPILGLLLATLAAGNASLAADLGRLFYTPTQRAQLEAARARNVTQARPAAAATAHPQRFDGVVIRSDGASTSWINGRPQTGVSGAAGLKPGQVRSAGKVYEPYQVLRPAREEPTR
jgi:citrate lyase beta subunit